MTLLLYFNYKKKLINSYLYKLVKTYIDVSENDRIFLYTAKNNI